MITASPSAVPGEQVERVVGRLARVDHERQARGARQLHLGDERAALVLARRVVALVVEPGLADRRAPWGARRTAPARRRRPSSKPSDSCGWRPTDTKTSSKSSAALMRVPARPRVHADREHPRRRRPRARSRPARGPAPRRVEVAVRIDHDADSRNVRAGASATVSGRLRGRLGRRRFDPALSARHADPDEDQGEPADRRPGDRLVEQQRAVGERESAGSGTRTGPPGRRRPPRSA